MATSLITRSPTALTVARPRLVRDPLIRPGTKMLFDFSDPRCHPGGEIAPGPVADGTVFRSLDTAPIPAFVVGTDIVINADGSLTFGGAGPAHQLRFGGAGQFNAAGAPYDCLLTLTLKIPANGYTTANYWSPFASGADNNDSQGQIDMGVGGIMPRAVLGIPGANPSNLAVASTGPITPGAVFQTGIRFDPSTRVSLVANGAMAVETTGSVPAGVVDGAGKFYRLQSSGRFTALRVSLTDLDASIAVETGYGLAAADILSAAQHVAADYAFGRGTLVGAPKTAFA